MFQENYVQVYTLTLSRKIFIQRYFYDKCASSYVKISENAFIFSDETLILVRVYI